MATQLKSRGDINNTVFLYKLSKLEKVLLFKKALQVEYSETEKQAKEILKHFNACMSAATVDSEIYNYLFRYLGIKINKSDVYKRDIYNKTAASEISKWASKFVENVFPQDADNFLITATEDCVDAVSVLYPEYSRDEVRSHLNSVLHELTKLVSSSINNGSFYRFFLDEVKIFFVRQFDCMVTPREQNNRSLQSNVVYKPIAPMSVAYDYSDEKEVIGVYRKMDMTIRNALLTYPDFNREVLSEADNANLSQTKSFKECCFIKFIDLLNEYRWVYIVFTGDDRIAVFRLLKFNPFLTFCETLPIGSSVGRGIFFYCYSDVLRAEEGTKMLEDTLNQVANPPIEMQPQNILNLDELGNVLKNGQIVKVNNMNSVRPISIGERPDIFATNVARNEASIKEGFSAERYEPEKSDTATAVTVNVSREVAFLSSRYGKVLKTFIFQIVQKTLFSLEETGDIYKCLSRFFNEDPLGRLPSSLFTNDIMADEELKAEVLDYFINMLVDAFLNVNFLSIRILSNLGLKQRYDDINRFVGMLQVFSSVSGQPPSVFFSFDKFLDKTIDEIGMDRNVFLTEKERREMQKALAASMAQNNTQN